MLSGLPYLLLLVVGGVAVVSGAVFGGFALQSFTWLTLLFPASVFFEWWQRLGPGLAGIGIGRRPDGVIPHVGAEMRETAHRQTQGARHHPTPATPSRLRPRRLRRPRRRGPEVAWRCSRSPTSRSVSAGSKR